MVAREAATKVAATRAAARAVAMVGVVSSLCSSISGAGGCQWNHSTADPSWH